MTHTDIVDTLNDLIETCKDGEYGFRTSAEHAKSAALRQLLGSRADGCRLAAGELQSLVAELGGKAEDSGTASGALHRGWVAVRSALSGYTDVAILEECERGEDAALERYRNALKKDLPPDVMTVVERQYEGVKRNHSSVRMMRDQERLASEHVEHH
jgi:uncharacterized protein (TIGR02284 family)